MPNGHGHIRDLLQLTLTPGLGPVLISRLLDTFGSANAALGISSERLKTVKGIGNAKASTIARGMAQARKDVDAELDRIDEAGASLIAIGQPDYPELLTTIPGAPPLLYIRGSICPADLDRYPLALVGSRKCTAYGIEQAERFGGTLGRAGITIVSGGARGIDTAAHRGTLRSAGRTIAVLGCGLSQCYPPENKDLFDRIVDEDRGAVVSELPMATAPSAENFPARNRIISGLSLGVLVIEAGRKSGALITARQAAEEHGREVMALPGRADSEASRGSLDLIKQGGAALVTEPADVLEVLESPARHHFGGTHESRYADPAAPAAPLPLTETQQTILDALSEPKTWDQLGLETGISQAGLRAEMTMLEIQRRVRRDGSRMERVR